MTPAPIDYATLDSLLAEHEADQHMGDRCPCATCDQVRALLVEMEDAR